MKRRTKRAEVRAAKQRAEKPSGKSRYALKKREQAHGHFRPTSPFVSTRETTTGGF